MKPLGIFLALSAVAGAEDLLPQPFSKDRYSETIARSPFVLETKSDAPAAEKINPFQNLFLRGIGKADGKDYVLIQRLGEERPMRFIGNEPSKEPGADELAVQSVRIGNTFRETRVVLKKGTEVGEIGFKEDTLNAPPPAAAGPARGPAMPGQFPKPGATMPQQVPSIRPPQPGTVQQPVPRPQGSVPMPQPAPIPQTPGAPKGRVRVINN